MTLREFLNSLAEDSAKLEVFNASPASATSLMEDAGLSPDVQALILDNDTEGIYQALVAEASQQPTVAAASQQPGAPAVPTRMMFFASATMVRVVGP